MDTTERPTPIPTFFMALWRISLLACLATICWVLLWMQQDMREGVRVLPGDVRISGQGYGTEAPVRVEIVR